MANFCSISRRDLIDYLRQSGFDGVVVPSVPEDNLEHS